MGKVWVLDTETKGTGANVVPLEKLQRQPEPTPKRPAKARSALTPAGRARALAAP